MSNKWTNTARVINAPAIESTADGVYLTTEQMDAIEASVSTPAQEQLTADLSAANANLQTAHARVKELENEVKTLKAKPAAPAAAAATTTDPVASTETKKQKREASLLEKDFEAQAIIRNHDWTKPLDEEDEA